MAQGKQPLEGGVKGVNGIGVDSDSVAGAVGVTRAVLCKWKNQLLGEEAPCNVFDSFYF